VTAAKRRKEDGRVLPLSSCIEYLRTHPFVTLFRLDARDLHAAVVHLDALTSLPDACPVDDGARVVTAMSGCFECNGYVMTDEHNGYEVCSECGLVQTLRTINVTPEYRAGVDPNTLPPPHRQARGIRGVPDWVVHSIAPRPETSYMNDLQHMNTYAHLSYDDLVECNRRLKRWRGGHFAPELRVAACLLHRLLRDRFLEESDVRRRVRTVVQQSGTVVVDGVMRPAWSMGMERMPVVHDVAPPPEFACPTCGHMEHTRKGATFHCKRGSRPHADVPCRIRRC